MKICFLSKEAKSCHLAWLLRKEKHTVSFYTVSNKFSHIWRGIECGQVDRMPDYKKFDLVIFDSVGGGRTADRLAGQVKVIGSSVFTDMLCTDSEFRDLITEGQLIPRDLINGYRIVEGLWLGEEVIPFRMEWKSIEGGAFGSLMQREVGFLELTNDIQLLDFAQQFLERGVRGLITWDTYTGTMSCDIGEAFWLLAQLAGFGILLDVPSFRSSGFVCGINLYAEGYPRPLTGISSADMWDVYLYDIFHSRQSLMTGTGFVSMVTKTGQSRREAYSLALSKINASGNLVLPDEETFSLPHTETSIQEDLPPDDFQSLPISQIDPVEATQPS